MNLVILAQECLGLNIKTAHHKKINHKIKNKIICKRNQIIRYRINNSLKKIDQNKHQNRQKIKGVKQKVKDKIEFIKI